MEQKFQTIRQTAKLGILSEYNLRLRLAQGRLPGVYSGNRFMVNVPMLMQKLDAERPAKQSQEKKLKGAPAKSAQHSGSLHLP